MADEIINKVRASLENFELAGFETGWASPEKDLYFKYFGNSNIEVRRYAVAAFVMYLGESYVGSSNHFYNRRFALEMYIKKFLQHQQQIKKDFPVMYEFIVHYLNRCEEEVSVRTQIYPDFIGGIYTNIDKELRQRLIQEVFIPNRTLLTKRLNTYDLMKEFKVDC